MARRPQVPNQCCHYTKMFLYGMLRVPIVVELSDQGTQTWDNGNSKVIFERVSHVIGQLVMFELPNKNVLHAAWHHISSVMVDLLLGLILLLLLIKSALNTRVIFLKDR